MGVQTSLTFAFRDAVNLHSPAAPHMRRIALTITDANRFSEQRTRTEKGANAVFDLQLVRH